VLGFIESGFHEREAAKVFVDLADVETPAIKLIEQQQDGGNE
jgi:hypothetical protein